MINNLLSDSIISNNDVLNINNQYASTFIRHKSNILALEAFYENPIFGAGIYEVKNEKRWNKTYYSHTYQVLIISAYGFYGMILFIVLFYTFFYTQNRNLKGESIMYFSYLMLSCLFVPGLYLWYLVPIINLKIKDENTLIQNNLKNPDN